MLTIGFGDPDDPVFQIKGRRYAGAYTIGTGKDAKIFLDPGIDTPAKFRADVATFVRAFVRRFNINSDQGLALVILRELTHATGKTIHEGDKVPYQSEVIDTDRLNQDLYDNCFK